MKIELKENRPVEQMTKITWMHITITADGLVLPLALKRDIDFISKIYKVTKLNSENLLIVKKMAIRTETRIKKLEEG